MCRQKNWNIFRRLNKTPWLLACLFAGLLFLANIFSGCGDKEERLYGRWRLQTTFMNGDTLKDSLQYNIIPERTVYDFFYENILTVSTFINGVPISSADGFYTFKDNSTINMRYTIRYQLYDITAKIKKLTRRELNLEYTDKGNKYLLIFYTN
jgi:hypothetical protein